MKKFNVIASLMLSGLVLIYVFAPAVFKADPVQVLEKMLQQVGFVTDIGKCDRMVEQINGLWNKGKYDECLAIADEIIEYRGGSNDDSDCQALGYFEKGKLLSAMNRKKEAIEYFSQSLQRRSEDSTANKYAFDNLVNIASAYRDLNQFDQAIDYYNKAIETDSGDYAHLKLLIADTYVRKHDKCRAISAFDEAKPRMKESEQAYRGNTAKGSPYYVAAWVAYQLHKDSEAREYAEKLNGLKGTDESQLIVATFFARLGQREKAKNEFQGISTEKCNSLSVSLFYLLIDDQANAGKYFNNYYEKQKTSVQRETLRLLLKRDLIYPRPDWSKARNQTWFKSRV